MLGCCHFRETNSKLISLGGGTSNIFGNVHPETWGRGFPIDAYFSDGLKPPTRMGGDGDDDDDDDDDDCFCQMLFDPLVLVK